MALHHLVYISSATSILRDDDLLLLLNQARALNERDDLTGLLLCVGGSFIQVLEGDAAAVHATYARIREDARHRRVKTLIDEPLTKREYPDWRMGFSNLDSPEVRLRPDVSTFLSEPLTDESFAEETSRVRRLLMFFKLKA